MLIRGLPLIVAAAPFIGINIAYWLGVQHDNLPSCFPYIDGCTSISSTGRYPPGDRLFRAILLPQAALLALTWHFCSLWLKSVGASVVKTRIAVWAGYIGALALIVYVSYLASNDPFYELMKRYGIYLYFLGTVVAQVAVTLALPKSRLRTVLIVMLAAPFVLGIFNFAHKVLISDLNSMENRIEWIVSLVMQAWFVGLFLEWRKTGFQVGVNTTTR